MCLGDVELIAFNLLIWQQDKQPHMCLGDVEFHKVQLVHLFFHV